MKTTIEMAREAGVYCGCTEWTIEKSNTFVTTHEAVKRLVALVRAEEREACAKVCDRIVAGKDPDDIHSDSQWAALSLAAEIRARGNT